jgi:hypothetical protein
MLTTDVAFAAARGAPNSPERAKYCGIKNAICRASFPDSYCEGKNTSVGRVATCVTQALQHCEDTFGKSSDCKTRP